MIGLEVTWLKKTLVVYLLGFSGEGGEVAVWFRVYRAPWATDWANVGSIDFFFTYGEYGFSRGVGPILGNGYEI